MTNPPLSEQSAQLVAEAVVPDLNQTVAFLVALGFRVDRTTQGFAVLRWENSYLFVAEDSGALTEKRWVNIRVIVPSADAMWEKVAQIGGRIVTTIADRPYGLRDFVLAAPGGVEIRFAQIL
jgi:catechol 2,3-dioxygenase-like lactoylglutathione lyase family enzyme